MRFYRTCLSAILFMIHISVSDCPKYMTLSVKIFLVSSVKVFHQVCLEWSLFSIDPADVTSMRLARLYLFRGSLLPSCEQVSFTSYNLNKIVKKRVYGLNFQGSEG